MLTKKRQHKHAARCLKTLIENPDEEFEIYHSYEKVLGLTPVNKDHKSLLDRLFLHEKEAGIPYSLQYKVKKEDSQSSTPFLEVDIYLENLRSMHNIGAILRSTEAFRLGKIYISKELPSSAIEKIKKTAMGTENHVEIKVCDDLSKLKKPLIAIETCIDAIDCNKFAFPKTFTLLLGNEQYGLSDEALNIADNIVHIPLFGSKNSLNVSTAFAIIANCIRNR